MNVSHGTKLVGAALVGFGLFACGTPAVTQGKVVGATYDPAHPKFKKVCKAKVKSSCLRYEKKPDGIDDADYDLQVSDGKHTSTIEVDNLAIYNACTVGSQYPACADGA